MTNEVTVRGMASWLLRNGFEELTGKKTGHRFLQKGSVKITLPGHGPKYPPGEGRLAWAGV
jgi:hypothetical protein